MAELEMGQRIKKERKRLKMTQAELANACDVATITIQQYERNKRIPRTKTLQKISKVLGVSMHYLLTGEHPDELTPNEQLEEFFKDEGAEYAANNAGLLRTQPGDDEKEYLKNAKNMSHDELLKETIKLLEQLPLEKFPFIAAFAEFLLKNDNETPPEE